MLGLMLMEEEEEKCIETTSKAMDSELVVREEDKV